MALTLRLRIFHLIFVSVITSITPVGASEKMDQTPQLGEPDICGFLLDGSPVPRYSIHFWNEYSRFRRSATFPKKTSWAQKLSTRRYMGVRLRLIGRKIPVSEEISTTTDLRQIYPDDLFEIYRIVKGDYFKAATDAANPFLDPWKRSQLQAQGLSTGRATIFDSNYEKQSAYVGDYVVVDRETSLVVAIFDYVTKVITPFLIPR